MFLKYKQTQPVCAKNKHAMDYIQNSSSDVKHRKNRHLDFILFIIVQ